MNSHREKQNKLSSVKIAALMAAFLLLCAALFALGQRLGRKEIVGDGNGFEDLAFYVKNHGKTIKINVFTDIRVNPAEYYVFLPSFADDKEIYISFELRDHAVLSGEDGQEVRLESGDRLPEMEIDRAYTLDFYKPGETKVSETGKLTFMQSDNTAALFIDTVSRSMEYLDSNKENHEPGTMLLLDESGFTEYRGKLEEIKGHGNSTWEREKKPYGIKLPKPVRLFDLRESDRFVLLSNCMDLSMIRNRLIYGMAEKLGYPATPRLHYADLYLNGNYNGLYLISEKPGMGKNSLGLTDLEFKNTELNLIPPAGAERVKESYEDNTFAAGVRLDVLPDDITGGYLVERDYGAKFDNEVSRFTTVNKNEYVLKSPVYAPIEEVRYIKGVFEEIERRIYAGEKLEDVLDLDSFARMYVLDEFTRNEGAGVTSAYYYKDRDSVDGRVYAGPVWDYDQCLGNTYFPVVNYPFSLNFCTDHYQSTLIFYMLYRNYPEFREKVRAYYKDSFRREMQELKNSGIDSCLKEAAANQGMDCSRWGRSQEVISESSDQARDFIEKRTEFLDSVWIEEKSVYIIHFDTGNGRDLYMGVTGGTVLGDFLDATAQGLEWKDAATGEKVDPRARVDRDFELTPMAP